MKEETPDNRTFVHRIDSNDMIVVVNDDWLSFGSENVYNLSQDLVVNKSLWDFITDKETRHLYQIMLEKVRNNNARIKVPFRCDSPAHRRFMELEIFTLDENLIEFRSRMVKLEFRPHVDLLDFSVDRSDEFVRICGWCKKIFVSEAKWVEVEEAVQELDLFGVPKLPQLSHGICPSCKDSLTQILDTD